jgi:uncharacterized protein (DUF1015 family)
MPPLKPLIRPFAGLRPRAELAQEVAAPPYDVLSSDEARKLAAGKPWSFLHISKPEIDLPPDTDPYAAAVYAKGRENFARMLREGVLQQDGSSCYYLYRLVRGAHVQTGLVAVASVADYDTNRIRKHEFTRPDKEDDRVRQIDALDAQTGPVFLTYRRQAEVDALVARITASTPEIDVVSGAEPTGEVRHSLWVVRDAADIAAFSSAFNRMDYLYIADGHHRSAAASRVAQLRRAANPHHTGDEPYNYFLAVIFPDTQMQILDYNRLVRDLNGLSKGEFLRGLESAFDVDPSGAPVKPTRTGEFGMYLAGQWYRLRVHPDLVLADPVKRLDVSLLADNLIAPILGIADPRRDKRIDFVGGIRGLAELVRRVDSGEMAVAFSLYPTSLADLMAVADAGEVMPPKSTWFEPKLADGLVSHSLKG